MVHPQVGSTGLASRLPPDLKNPKFPEAQKAKTSEQSFVNKTKYTKLSKHN